jgi:hypothetical protein
VHIEVSDDYVEVRLAAWQKLLGLQRNIRVPRAQVSDVQIVCDPVREAMHTGVKVGLRLPWLYYVARTLALDQAFVVSRGVPAISFVVDGAGRLRRVLVSTPEAEDLARRLAQG